MRVTIYMGLSVDGFAARTDDALDFLPPPPEGEAGDGGFGAFLATVDAMVMGRRTFDVVRRFGADHWPYGATRIVVLSRTLGALPAGTPATVSLATSDDGLLERLAAEGANHVYVDGCATARAWLAAGRVTDLVITSVPVLIGQGISPWGPLPRDAKLALVTSRALPGGMVQSHYTVVTAGG